MQSLLQSIPANVHTLKPVRHAEYSVMLRSLLQKSIWEGLNAEQADALAFLIHADALRLASSTVEGGYPGRLVIRCLLQLGINKYAYY